MKNLILLITLFALSLPVYAKRNEVPAPERVKQIQEEFLSLPRPLEVKIVTEAYGRTDKVYIHQIELLGESLEFASKYPKGEIIYSLWTMYMSDYTKLDVGYIYYGLLSQYSKGIEVEEHKKVKFETKYEISEIRDLSTEDFELFYYGADLMMKGYMRNYLRSRQEAQILSESPLLVELGAQGSPQPSSPQSEPVAEETPIAEPTQIEDAVEVVEEIPEPDIEEAKSEEVPEATSEPVAETEAPKPDNPLLYLLLAAVILGGVAFALRKKK